jgi:hypothetical protein
VDASSVDAAEGAADDEREHTTQLGGRTTLGNVSSFGLDHQGELLLLNWQVGQIVRIAPDFAVVPRAPTVAASIGEARIVLTWTMPADSVAVREYAVERVRQHVVVERIMVERPEAFMDVSDGDCLRVRAVGTGGASGPPSTAVCYPE